MHQEKMGVGQQGWQGGDFFWNANESAAPTFLLQPEIRAIEYGSSDEVVQLYQSINVAYVAPEGRGQEICQGYICCIRKGVGTSVYIALLGRDSGRIRVYLPDAQPSDDESCRATVAAAIAFGDQIGLVMEPEMLDVSPQRRRELLGSCPVLKERVG